MRGPFNGGTELTDHRTADAIHTIWWQVGLGVFLALSAHSLIEAAYTRYQMQQVSRQLDAELKKLPGVVNRPMPVQQEHRPTPLRPNERCMQGRRFERVENGWKQINEPC